MGRRKPYMTGQYLKDAKKKLQRSITRNYVPLIGDYFMGSYADTSNYQKVFSCDFYTRCGYIIKGFYYGPESVIFGDLVMARNKEEKGYLAGVFERIYSLGEELLRLTETIRKTDYSCVGEEELIELFRKFSEMYQTFAISLMGFNIQFPVERKLRELVKGRKNPDEGLSVLSFPSKENFSAQEQANLLRIRSILDKSRITTMEALTKEARKEINDHAYEYGWINARGGQDRPWSEKEIFDRCMGITGDASEKLADLREHKEKIRKKCEKLLRELKADEEIFTFVMIAKELVYFRTYRTDYLNKSFFNIKNLLETIAKKRGLSYNDMMHLRIDEIINNSKVPRSEISRRMKEYMLITLEQGKLIFSSDPGEIEKVLRDHCEELSSDAEEIKGTAAYKGLVKGRAKIVANKKEMAKVERGDILIAPMTTPDMLPAMERAAGFVTDEGGITCHAAIVARELKKPCVIGTKVATKTFSDGELIEVDADNGKVRSIK